MTLNDEKPRVILQEYKVTHNVPSAETIFDEEFNMDTFKKRLRVVVVRYNSLEMEIDLIGIHPFIANTFRRIMLSDVPTMAIDQVIIANNTSILRDEVLAHRIGLIPLKADPRLFEFRPDGVTEENEQNTLAFELKIKCTSNAGAQKDSTLPEDVYKNSNVYSKHIKWLPIGSQESMYKEKDVGPVHNDILINKLRPGQEIDLKMIAVKGVGKDHAKFSPVATVLYRILPDIRLTREVSGEQAQRLQQCFAPGVIELRSNGPSPEQRVAYVKSARYDTCSRNVFRYDDLKDAVIMSRIKDHFIFNIESTGALAPDVIFIEAIKILKQKTTALLEALENK